MMAFMSIPLLLYLARCLYNQHIPGEETMQQLTQGALALSTEVNTVCTSPVRHTGHRNTTSVWTKCHFEAASLDFTLVSTGVYLFEVTALFTRCNC